MVRPQRHQHRGPLLGQFEGELGGIVAAVEHEQRHGLAGGQPGQQRPDLCCGGLVGVLQRVEAAGIHRAVQESRSKLTWAIHWKTQPAMIG
jgi:hypothetical protein